jgi:hypothetical protein
VTSQRIETHNKPTQPDASKAGAADARRYVACFKNILVFRIGSKQIIHIFLASEKCPQGEPIAQKRVANLG